MKKLLLVMLGVLAFHFSFSQEQRSYSQLIGEASKLYQAKEFLASAKKYSEALVVPEKGRIVDDRYNAACAWALAGHTDSAFLQLFIAVNEGKYGNYSHISSDTDFSSLHGDKRWNEVLEIVKANKEKAEANLDKTLVVLLDEVYGEDQNYRKQIDGIEKQYGWDSKEMKAHWKVINEKDSINLVKVKKILDERGWLGADVIGARGNQTLFLVIQHADLETQQRYLPMMRDAAGKGKAKPGSLALLEDRVALRQGKRQIYGSQVSRNAKTQEYYVLPLEDPDNVDKRRASVGLGTIQEYISTWGMTWNVEDYKKKLPELEAKQIKL